MPEEWRRSSSAQSGGAEHAISVPVSFSTQRNAGMFSFDPRRMPAWLAPVCEERSGSHSVRSCEPSATQRAMFVALPSRIARRRIGRARPSISRKTIPGRSVAVRSPERLASRWITRSVYVSSSAAPIITCSTRLTAAATSATSSAAQKESSEMAPSVSASAASRIAASATRTSRKPATSVKGSRSAASTGGRMALRTATTSATTSAPQKPSISTPGRIAAATSSDRAATSQLAIRRAGLIFGSSGSQESCSPKPPDGSGT